MNLMSEPNELTPEDVRDNEENRKALRSAIAEFHNCLDSYDQWEKTPDGIPHELIDEFQPLLARLCAHVGHDWRLDMCGWVDHAYCIVCDEPCGPEDLDDLREMFPKRRFSPKSRRYDKWKNWKDPRSLLEKLGIR